MAASSKKMLAAVARQRLQAGSGSGDSDKPKNPGQKKLGTGNGAVRRPPTSGRNRGQLVVQKTDNSGKWRPPKGADYRNGTWYNKNGGRIATASTEDSPMIPINRKVNRSYR